MTGLLLFGNEGSDTPVPGKSRDWPAYSMCLLQKHFSSCS